MALSAGGHNKNTNFDRKVKKKMIFRETTQEDIDFVANNSISRSVFKNQPKKTDFRYTLEHEGKILGIGGFRLINAITAWCWVDITNCVGSNNRAAYRVMKEWIDIFAKDHNIKRLQAYVECDFPGAVRMVRHLGFRWESDMKNFMGDKDAFMYVRIL